MCICVSDKVLCLFCTYCGSHIQQAVFSLFLSLMCFPCVLERQTQLHFNDTQMLLGFRTHVYVCMYACMWVGGFLCVRVCVFLFDHFDQPNTSLLKLLLLYKNSPPLPHLVRVYVSVQWVCSSESDETLSGISEQLCLPWNGLSASSTLTGDLFTPPSLLLYTPIHKHTYAHSQNIHTCSHTNCRESPDEMRQAVSFKWPQKQYCCWVINETNTRWHFLPLTFFLSRSPSLTQHKWSHLLSPLLPLPHINLSIFNTCAADKFSFSLIALFFSRFLLPIKKGKRFSLSINTDGRNFSCIKTRVTERKT